VVDGFAAARGDVLVVMDADLSHPPETVPALADAVAAGSDLAVGSRYVFLIHERLLPEHELAEKVVLSRVLSLLARGQAEGALRADVRVEWLGTCFGGLVHSAIENADLHGLGVEGAAAVVTDQFLHGAAVQG